MEAEEYYQTNYRAVHNTMFKENQKIKQFDFNDMVDFATQFSQSQNKELTEQLEKEKRESNKLIKSLAHVMAQLEKIDKIANYILMDASQYPDDELNQQAGDIRGIIHELTQNQE